MSQPFGTLYSNWMQATYMCISLGVYCIIDKFQDCTYLASKVIGITTTAVANGLKKGTYTLSKYFTGFLFP